jgi:hypothetical protein
MNRSGTALGRPAALLAPLLLPLLFVLSACGGGEESATPAAPTASAPASPDGQEPAAPTEGGDADGEGNDSRFGASLETIGETLVETFENAAAFSVDGTTLTLVFDDGSAGFDGSIDCLSAAGLLQDGETLVLQYPDGSAEC